MYYAFLPDRGLIVLSGDDASAFLQGLITNNVSLLERGQVMYAALLTPQGKFLHDFFCVPMDGKILIDCEKARRDDLIKRLSLYKLRSKVKIEAMDDVGVVAVWKEQVSGFRFQDSEASFPDPRLPELGTRIIGNIKNIESVLTGQGVVAGDYDTMRLSLGVPDGSRDMIPEKTFLAEAGFEFLHGIDFAKGCYVGQEVVARTKYRGQVKKCLHIVTSETGELPETGTPVYAGEAIIGEMRSHAGKTGLAIIRLEELEKARSAAAAIRTAGVDITVTKPAWMGIINA